MSDQTRVPQYLGTYDTPRNLTVVGDRAYFTAINSTGRAELNYVDPVGFAQSVIILEGSFWKSFDAKSLLAVGEELYFTGRKSGSSGYELWKTDGSSSGTVKIKTIYTGGNEYVPYLQAVIDGVVYLTANNGVHGTEWWKSDGTELGKQMIADINPDAGNGAGDSIMKVGNTIYLTAQNGTQGYELWTYDPTGIPSLLKDFYVGSSHSYPGWFTALGDRLIFTAADLTSGREVYSTDGTASGTVKLTNIPGGGTSIGPVQLIESNGFVYFGVDVSGSTGNQLWKTDGTLAGTGLLKQISTNVANGMVSAISHEGILYFSAQTESHGTELWRSDGTFDGTFEVADIAPGAARSSPKNFVSVGGALYFYAENYQFGRELYVIPSPSDSGDFNLDGVVDNADLELWQAYFGATEGPGLTADANRNGQVDGRDFLIWQRNFTPSQAGVVAFTNAVEQVALSEDHVDAVMSWKDVSSDQQEPDPWSESQSFPAWVDKDFPLPGFELPVKDLADKDGSSGVRQELREQEIVWLSDELLECVFG